MNEPIYPALCYPPLWGGVPRLALVLIWGGAFLLFIKHSTLWGFMAGLLLHVGVAVCIHHDKNFFQVLYQHLQDPNYWRA